MRRINATDAQALMVWATGPTTVDIAKEFAASGSRMLLTMSHGAAAPEFVKGAGPAAEGVVLATTFPGVAADLPASKVKNSVLAMSKRFVQTHGTNPPQFDVDGYVAVKLMAAAIEKAQSANPERIQKALAELKLVTPEGEYVYTDRDHAGLSPEDVAIAVVRDGTMRLTDWSKNRLD